MRRESDAVAWIAGVAIALVALTVSAVGCDDERAIGLFPVELVEPAADEPFATDPLLAPPPLDCGDCGERRAVLAGGDVVVVRAAAAPALTFARTDVAFVELGKTGPGETVGEEIEIAERFAVYAVLTASAGERWERFAAEHATRPVLVEIEGLTVDLVRPLGWSRGLRIGVFADEGSRDRFVAGLPFVRGDPGVADSMDR